MDADLVALGPAPCPSASAFLDFYAQSPTAESPTSPNANGAVRRRKTRRDSNTPPRPPNAFILYRRHQQSWIRDHKPGVHLQQASKLIADWWKNEPEPVLRYYRALAEKVKREHNKRFPGYRYRPRQMTVSSSSPSNTNIADSLLGPMTDGKFSTAWDGMEQFQQAMHWASYGASVPTVNISKGNGDTLSNN